MPPCKASWSGAELGEGKRLRLDPLAVVYHFS